MKACPAGFSPAFNQKCYKKLGGLQNHSEAMATCHAENARMALPYNLVESKLLATLAVDTNFVWIRADDKAAEGM